MRQTKEQKKGALLAGLIEVRQAILDVARSLPPEKQDTLFLGKWSIKHLIAHLAGWDYANLQAIAAVQAGQIPEFYAHSGPDWRAYNDELVQTYFMPDMERLIQTVKDSHAALLEQVAATPAGDLYRDYAVRVRGYKVVIARLLEAEQKDEMVHLEQIKHFAQVV